MVIMLKVINLKENRQLLDVALATVEIELEHAAAENVSVIKVLHGYGSHGKGGVILIELRRKLGDLKRHGKIVDFFGGDDWNIFNKRAQFALNRDKTIAGDEDLNKANPGITIIVL